MSDTPRMDAARERQLFALGYDAEEIARDCYAEGCKLERELGAAQSALHQCYAATGEEAGDIDDFRALQDRERTTVEAVNEMRRELDQAQEELRQVRAKLFAEETNRNELAILGAERDRLLAERDTAREDLVHLQHAYDTNDEAHKAVNAAMLADKARLVEELSRLREIVCDEDRAAIDAAMQPARSAPADAKEGAQ